MTPAIRANTPPTGFYNPCRPPQHANPGIKETIVDNALYIFYANQAGKSGNAWFPGLAFAIDPNGQFIDEHAPVEGMIVTEVSRELIEKARSSGCFTANEARPDLYASPQIVRGPP